MEISMKIGFVSLGCPKNQLDAEVMLHELLAAGHEITADETKADVVIINTCGFIESAKRESIDAILDIAWLKKHNGLKGIIVTGCLAERYRESIFEEMPEVDAVLGGESSGGLTVRGHIFGKDSVYAASLFVEMVCAIGKTPTEFWRELTEKYGYYEMVECNLSFTQSEKERVERLIMTDKQLPEFKKSVSRVSYEDGCKVYFEDEAFLICRFSGTEPLLRIFAEADNSQAATDMINVMRRFIEVKK